AWLGPADVATAAAAAELAAREFWVGHPGEADSLAGAARGAFAAALGPASPRVADAEELLGMIAKNYGGSHAYATAIAHYHAALRIRLACLGPHADPVAATWQDIGNLERLSRRPAAAYRLFSTALDIRLAHGARGEDVASVLGAMAFLRAGEGRWPEAEALARRAQAATPAGDGASTDAFALRLGLQGQMLRRMGRNAEAARVLRQAVALREASWARTARDPGSTVFSGLGLHRDLALALAGLGRGDEAFEELERGSARTLAAPADTAERALTGAAGAGDPWRGLLARVQRALAPDEALVEWPQASGTTVFVADYPMYACIVRSHGPVQWVRLEQRSPWYHGLGSVRSALFAELRAASGWPGRVTDVQAVNEEAHRMWSEWFAPLEPALAGVRHLIVCSPDLLAGGPLGVLRDDRGRFLSDRFTISYAPSALWFAHSRAANGARVPARGAGPALLVGDPHYPAAEPGWGALPGSAAEIRDLATRFPSATTLTGDRASAASLRALSQSGALARYRVVHIAAHAAIEPERVMESALVLAPDAPGAATSSRLTAREIASTWRLDADLVSLAACRGIEGVGSATEGFMGLNQAFLAAGARSLLVAIWPVDDDATALLMRAFYARLADPTRPMDAAQALSEAADTLREWRAPDGSHPYAHPAYWSGFVLVGDTR
ncbi:MAG TPA: CHAT domain-containing tetratricopeptide repeat protein, partial [Candidatus Eisenbacteria bacterium]|nr:CHAT domain-containing tetratricopeptide repeat protein [Candidatus Eisenbacteria bacterium]